MEDDDRLAWRRPVTRWALIVSISEHNPELSSIRLVSESRVEAWQRSGWQLLVNDSMVRDQDIADVRNEDERGHR